MLARHVKLGIPMDRMYCPVNDLNYHITSHDLHTVRQYKIGNIWQKHVMCRKCTFEDTYKIDAPEPEYVNVER